MTKIITQLANYRLSCQLLASELIPTGDAQFNAKHPRNPDGTFAEKNKPQKGLGQIAVEGVVATGVALTTIGYLGNRRSQFKRANAKANAASVAKTTAETIAKQRREAEAAADSLLQSLNERDRIIKAKEAAAKSRAARKEHDRLVAIEQARKADAKAIRVGKKITRTEKKVQITRGVKMIQGRSEVPSNPVESLLHSIQDHFLARAKQEIKGSPNRIDNVFESALLLQTGKILDWRDGQVKLMLAQRPKPEREAVEALGRQLDNQVKEMIASIPDIGFQKGGDYSIISKIQEISIEEQVEQAEIRAARFLQGLANQIEADRQAVLASIDSATAAAKTRLEQGGSLPPPTLVVKQPTKRKAKSKSPTQGKGFGK